jgi:molybdenum cofactor cytidylyltransferase
MTPTKIVPILLAAGSSERLGFPKPLALFGKKTALAIAVRNCKGLERPIVVLGCDAGRIRPEVPRGVRVVINRRWQTGQLTSLLCALKQVPRGSAFMLYPLDLPLLRRRTIEKLVRAFHKRPASKEIVVPSHRGKQGHPVIIAPSLRREFQDAKTAREVIYRMPQRVLEIEVRTFSIITDFHTPETYRACLRRYRARN